MTYRVLVVEDSRTQAEALADLLESNGYQTITMRDGASALEYLGIERPDLILCDVLMPGIDGYEVCRRIRNGPDTRDLPVVLLTSLNDPIAIVRALECGADSYVTKPFDRDRLLSRISSVLETAAKAGTRRDPEPVDIIAGGMPFTILAGKEQILNLCVASYDDLVASSEQTRVAERRARFLAEAGAVLSGSLDADVVLEQLAELCVPTLADLAVVDVIEGSSEPLVRRVAVRYSDPSMAAYADSFSAHAIDLEAQSMLSAALRDGVASLVTEVTPAMLGELSNGPEQLAGFTGLELASVVVVPLVSRGRVLGSLLFASTEGRQLGDADLALAKELATAAALALDNAQLYRSAQQASRARDDMLAIVSHDLRNPLHTISMSAGLLQDLRRLPDAELPLDRQLPIILRAANRANGLIEDLLDVTRIESGILAIAPSRQLASDLIADALSDAQVLAATRGIAIVATLPPPDLAVCADRARIAQLFSNLIGNAMKFTPRDGGITVAAEVSGAFVRFSVTDTGVGIPPSDVEHVFDRFWQAERASRSGAGLGLFISRGIAEAHGGGIGVTSIAGSGSTFYFTLPVAATSPEAGEECQPEGHVSDGQLLTRD